jgi:flavodoxin
MKRGEQMIKKYLTLMLIAIMSLSALAGCGSSEEAAPAEDQAAAQEEQTAETESAEPAADSDTLVAYFTRIGNTDGDFPEGVDAETSASIQVTDEGKKGNAQMIAEWVADETGGELFAIQSSDLYPADYNETVDKASEDQSKDARPELTTHVEDMDKYSTVVLVYPNWWGDLPMAVYSFLDEYDLSGKNVILYCTHEGSRFSGTVDTVKELEPDATVTEGLSIRGGEVANSEADVRDSI